MKALTTLSLIGTLVFGSVAIADDIAIIPIQKPAVLNEGTQRELTAAQIAELLPWAKDSKVFLLDLLDNTQALTMTDKVDRLIEGIKSSVIDSAPKNSELLMRYALNRAVVINEILDREMDADIVGTIDTKVRVLNLSIKMALKYYDADMATLSKKTASPFADFGKEYFKFLTELNKSIFDASAQYAIQRTSLEWLEWDLYRDLNNTAYAPQIVKINNALKTFPTKKISDAQSISYIRQMKKISEQLNIIAKVETPTQSQDTVFNSNRDEEPVARKGKFKSYDGDCYAADVNGSILWDAGKQFWRNCHSGNYRTYDGDCYAQDASGSILWGAGKQDWKMCHSGSYKSYDGYCYALDASGSFLWGAGKQSWNQCHSGKYKTYDGACYPTDRSGSILWGAGKVSYQFCQ